jgi:hypothetical protein
METTMQQIQVPAWLNLDEIAPPDLRGDIAATIDRLKAIEPVIREIATAARSALERSEEAEHKASRDVDRFDDGDVNDGVCKLVAAALGADVLLRLLNNLSDALDPDEVLRVDPESEPVDVGPLHLDGAAVAKLRDVAKRAPMVHAMATRLAREAWEALRPQLEAAKAVDDTVTAQEDFDAFAELTGASAVRGVAFDLMQAWLPASTVDGSDIFSPEWYDDADRRLITSGGSVIA